MKLLGLNPAEGWVVVGGMTFPEGLVGAFRGAPDIAAFEYQGRVVLRGEVLEFIGRLVWAMRERGLGPGTGVAMATAVSPEGFAAHMAAHVLGCRVVGVRPGYPMRQLAHVLGSGVDAVVADASTLSAEVRAAAGPGVVLALDDLLATSAQGPLEAVGRPGAVARLVYTSGSTGLPKGCAHNYEAMSTLSLWQPRVWDRAIRQLAGCTERYLLFGTLGSVVVMEFLALCLLSGGTAVIPDEALFPQVIERYRITGTIMTVPRLYQMLDDLDGVDTSSLRGVMAAGSPINPRRLAEAADRLGPVVYFSYGQSEAGPLSILTPEDIAAGPPELLSSVGRPHPHVEVSIRDSDGRPVPEGTTGEVFVRPYLMSGYWDNPTETADVLVDGWLRTRDLGRLRDGFLYLAGRTRDVIIVNAFPYYAGPIESALAKHPYVDQAYVVGAPDETTGEAVHAYVIPTDGVLPDQQALRDIVRVELGEACVPRTITVVPDVPIAASGKPDKRALLSRYPPART